MPHQRRTTTPTVNGQPVTIWLSPATLKWLALQGDAGEVAAGIIERASIKSRTPTEPRTRAWRNPAYETAMLPAKPPQPSSIRRVRRVVAEPSPSPAADSDTPALRFNIMVQQMHLRPTWRYSRDEDGWLCVLRLNGKQYMGIGDTKKIAKQKCCRSFLEEAGTCV